jgi:hypothetical protein
MQRPTGQGASFVLYTWGDSSLIGREASEDHPADLPCPVLLRVGAAPSASTSGRTGAQIPDVDGAAISAFSLGATHGALCTRTSHPPAQCTARSGGLNLGLYPQPCRSRCRVHMYVKVNVVAGACARLMVSLRATQGAWGLRAGWDMATSASTETRLWSKACTSKGYSPAQHPPPLLPSVVER